MTLALRKLKIYHGVLGGVFDPSDSLIGHEVLGKGLFFVRFKPCKVWLVVGKYAGHQLDVWPVRLGQITVPCPAEIRVSPSPLLLSGGNVMIRYMEKSRINPRVIIADKVII